MAALMNGSFASPFANADYIALSSVDGGLFSRVYSSMSGLSLTVTVLFMLVAYDQCEFAEYPQFLRVADTRYSHVCLEQGINCWTIVEDALHWAILAIREPKNGRIQGKMGEWRLELCISVP